MKNTRLAGALFKIHRKRKNVIIHEVEKKSDIISSVISDFENGKRSLTSEKITLLYQCIGMEYNGSSQIDEFLKCLNQIIFDIIHDSTINTTHEELYKYENCVQFNDCYFLFELAQLLCSIYCDDFKLSYTKKRELIHDLEQYIDYVKLDYKAIAYDTLALYYEVDNYEKALEYFSLALNFVVHDEEKALILYHIGMNKNYRGELSEAVELFRKAKVIFDAHLIYTRGLMCHIEMGIVYMQLGLYERAKKLNLECIYYAKNKQELKSKLICAYNNLLWLYICDKQYKNVLTYKDDVLALDELNPNFLSYIGIAYYYLDDKQQAIIYLERTKEESVRATKNQLALTDVYLTMIYRNRYREIENKLKYAYDCSVNEYDLQLQTFILQLQIENQLKFNQTEKLADLQSLLIQKLKERK